ncbi:MAG: hypothetical protein WCG87_07810 [Bacteroidota bacterium]
MLLKSTPLALVLGSVMLFTASCGNNDASKGSTAKNDVKAIQPITIVPVGNSPEFADAQLLLKSAIATKKDKDSTELTFMFDVKNYELKSQTTDTGSKMCNNSAQGQHIHFILDNMPYKALYEPTNKVTVVNNTEHYLMAFLSRSYHESIKSKGASVMYHFSVDAAGKIKVLPDPKTAMIFYSRPKGDYMGKDTANVMLDFYVWNGKLSKDSIQVQVKLTNDNTPGRDTTFSITEWKPYFIKNLMTGKCHATLTLTDKNGAEVDGPNVKIMRSFSLAASEPLK